MSQGNSNQSFDNARILGPDGQDKQQRRPFGGRQCLYNVVRVRLGEAPFDEPYDAGELLLVPEDRVVADTPKGPMLAVVTGVVMRQLMERGRIHRIIRRATEADIEQYRRNRDKAKEAFSFCLKRIQARNLNMKLCQVEYMLDRSRVLFSFSADHRIDFRQLVRDLARQLNTRIEMRQIGVRDGAGLIGGIGHCGKELCCCSFLRNHSSISIRHAKDQGITLNPKKVSGMCGRLMCCLVYEHEVYLKCREGAPRIHRAVETEKGSGVVSEVDLLQGKVRVVLENGATETFAFHEVLVDNETIRRPQDIKQYATARPKRPTAVAPTESHPEEDYQWEGVEPDESFTELTLVARPDEEPGQAPATPDESPGATTSNGQEAPSTRRRPGRRKRRGRRDTQSAQTTDRPARDAHPVDRPPSPHRLQKEPPSTSTPAPSGQKPTGQQAQDQTSRPSGEPSKPRRRFRPGRNRGRKQGPNR